MKRAAFASLLAGAAAAPRIASRKGRRPSSGSAPRRSKVIRSCITASSAASSKPRTSTCRCKAFAGGGGVMTAAAGGALDMGCANVAAQATAHLRGLPFSMIAGGGMYSTDSPTTVLAIAKNSHAQNRQRPQRQDGGRLDAQRLAASVGNEMGRHKRRRFVDVEVPRNSRARNGAGAQAGRIDASCLLEPSLTFAKNDIKVLGKCYDAIAKHLMITTHFANNDWLDKNPRRPRAFIGAMRQTAQWANKNQAAAGAILGEDLEDTRDDRRSDGPRRLCGNARYAEHPARNRRRRAIQIPTQDVQRRRDVLVASEIMSDTAKPAAAQRSPAAAG